MIKILIPNDNIPCLCEPLQLIVWEIKNNIGAVISTISGDPSDDVVTDAYFVGGTVNSPEVDFSQLTDLNKFTITRTVLDGCGDTTTYTEEYTGPSFSCDIHDSFATSIVPKTTDISGITFEVSGNNDFVPLEFFVPTCCPTGATTDITTTGYEVTVNNSNGTSFTFELPNDDTDNFITSSNVVNTEGNSEVTLLNSNGTQFSFDIPDCCITDSDVVSSPTGITVTLTQVNGEDVIFELPTDDTNTFVTGLTTSDSDTDTTITVTQNDGSTFSVDVPKFKCEDLADCGIENLGNVATGATEGDVLCFVGGEWIPSELVLDCKVEVEQTQEPIILQNVIGGDTFLVSDELSGVTDLRVFANGARQFEGLPEFGFNTEDNGDGTFNVVTTQLWGTTESPCTIVIEYSKFVLVDVQCNKTI